MSAAVSKPQLARAIAVLESAGKVVKGLLCQPDGSIAVLTEAPALPVVETQDESDWLRWAGDDERPTKGN